MDEWKIPWSLRKLLDQSTIKDWLHTPVLTVRGYQNYIGFLRANSGWCSVTCHLTVFYVMAYLFLKSISCCIGWLTEIVKYLFSGSPPPPDPRKIARMVCKNLRKYIWEYFCLQMWIHFITEFLAYNWYGNFREIIAPLFPVIKELSPGLIFPFLLLPPSPTFNILPWCNKRFGYFS